MNLEAGETAGLFELSFSLKNITKLICSIYSMNTSYSTTVRCYISLSTTIPKNLTEMQSAPFYNYGTYGSKKEYSFDIPDTLDRTKKYYLFFMSNHRYGGGNSWYQSLGISGIKLS